MWPPPGEDRPGVKTGGEPFSVEVALSTASRPFQGTLGRKAIRAFSFSSCKDEFSSRKEHQCLLYRGAS